MGEPAERQGSQRPEQKKEAEVASDRQPVDAGSKEEREKREDRGETPHDRLQPLHRYAEQPGAGRQLRRRPDRDTQSRVPQDRHHTCDRDRRQDHCDHVVLVEEAGSDAEREVERSVDALGLDGGVPPGRQQQRAEAEELSDADGGDGDDEPWRLEEPPDDQKLGGHAQDRGSREADREREVPVQSGLDDQQHDEDRWEEAQLTGREVENPVGPVHEVHPEGDEGSDQSEDEPRDN